MNLAIGYDRIISGLIYLAIGGGVYLWGWGEPGAITLKLFVVLFAWPFVLIYWAMWWVLAAMAALLLIGWGAYLGDRYEWF